MNQRPDLETAHIAATDAPPVACGDETVLVGRQGATEISLMEFSRAADTIPWETLTSVTKHSSTE